MATVETRLSADEFFAWLGQVGKGEKTFELERGEIVETPSPGELHGVICFLIVRLLGNYAFQRGKGFLCSNDTGLLVESNPDTVRGPDVMLFAESRALEQMSRKFSDKVPELVVEVLSPNDQTTKTNRRISQYLARGVPIVWLVDPEVHSVTIFRPDRAHVVLDETEEITGGEILPDLRIRVAEMFALPGASGKS
jgi:Uma2 family endonuclease